MCSHFWLYIPLQIKEKSTVPIQYIATLNLLDVVNNKGPLQKQ